MAGMVVSMVWFHPLASCMKKLCYLENSPKVQAKPWHMTAVVQARSLEELELGQGARQIRAMAGFQTDGGPVVPVVQSAERWW